MDENIELDDAAPWLVIAITLLGFFLRALQLNIKSMWLDETFSVWMASQSVPDMLQWVVKIDQHPPLYYLLLHYWVNAFGDTPYYARLLSALFGAGAIPIIYLIGKRLGSVMVGLAAAVFLAASTLNIYVSQETRMYALLTFNAAVAIYALVRLLTDPRSSALPFGSQFRAYPRIWRAADKADPGERGDSGLPYQSRAQSGWRAWLARHRGLHLEAIETDLAWVALIVFSVATLFSHNTAVLFPLATNFVVLGLILFQRLKKPAGQPSLQAPSLRNWIIAQIATLLLWSPWLPLFIKQAGGVDQRFWIPAPTWETILWSLRSFLNASAPLSEGVSLVVWGLYGAVLLLGAVYFRKKLSQFFLLAGLFAIPILGELIVSLRRPIYSERTLIWVTIPLFIFLAAGISKLKNRFVIFIAIGVFGSINLFSAGDYFRWFQKEDWSTPAGYVAKFAEPGDLVLFNSNFTVIPFNYYFRQYEDLYSIEIERQGVPKDLIQDAVLEPEMTEEDIPALLSLVSGEDRVWLVYSHDSYTDPRGLVPQTLDSQMKVTRTREFYGGVLYLYERP